VDEKSKGFDVTFEQVRSCEWQDVGVDDLEGIVDESSSRLFQKAKGCREAGDELGERVFQFLGAVMSLMPNFDSGDQPFRPMWIDGTRRSAALEDFSEKDAALLGCLSKEAENAKLRARLADVSAFIKFDHELVREASSAYLQIARKKETCENWPRFINDLKRATSLAGKLGKKQQAFKEASTYIESLLEKFSPTDKGLCCAELMDLMQQFGFGDSAAYAVLSEGLAKRAEENKNALFARTYWEIAADWHRRNDSKADGQRCAICAAETYVMDAEAALERGQPSYMASASHLAQAVEALRRSGAPKKRIEEVQRLLLERQKKIKEEMGSISHEMQIGELRDKARKVVSGCDLREAIVRLATHIAPLDPKKHRAEIEQLAKDHPITFLFSASAVDREGRVVAQRPSMFTTDPKQYEAALWAEMLHQATSIHWPFRISGFIDPCRLQIWEDHHPRSKDLQFLTFNNPFVSPGHEHSFARGFYAGFEGDFHTAAYFLVPQIENSIRYVLENRGVITSKLDNKLIQEVRSLDKLLQLPETTEAFGEDHVFEMKGILTEEFGSNLRNRLAHGLVTDGECYTPAVLHLWWLLLRFCVIPFLRRSE
jgi:hypothetical protein